MQTTTYRTFSDPPERFTTAARDSAATARYSGRQARAYAGVVGSLLRHEVPQRDEHALLLTSIEGARGRGHVAS